MNHYSHIENRFHNCNAEECKKKSKYQVYPSGQLAGHMHGSTMMCPEHFKLFKKRYWESIDAFYKAAQNGEITSIVKVIHQ